MNSNYLLSMLGLVGNSLGLEQWLAHILPLQGQLLCCPCIGLLKVAQPNTASVKIVKASSAIGVKCLLCQGGVMMTNAECWIWRCCHLHLQHT